MAIFSWGQSNDASKDILKCITKSVIFDYFRQQYDSTIFIIGSVAVMRGDSLSFKTKNDYCIDSSDTELKIYFKNRLLYKYELHKGKIEGTGFCYYPFANAVAIQGQFKDSKLDGLVFVQSRDGSLIEVMEFKKGKYLKHIYHWLSLDKKSLKARSKGRSSNPLRRDEVIKR